MNWLAFILRKNFENTGPNWQPGSLQLALKLNGAFVLKSNTILCLTQSENSRIKQSHTMKFSGFQLIIKHK
jgi:hypothetical protein